MAYGIKWTISFQSVGGTNYTINILQNGFSGTAKSLRPADKPLTIDEDNSDDYFEPIRTQSGYIRIINDSTDLNGNTFSYTELIATNATSHMVNVKMGNTTIWVGYIKPVVLTSTLFGYRNVVEIPIQCPLAVLQTINLKFDNSHTFPTIGQIIHMFFSRLGITWNYLYLTANVNHGSGSPFPDLNAKINMFNFSDNDNPTMTSTSFYSYVAEWEDSTPCGNVLEKICKFFGWTLYTRGTEIYLIASGLIHDYYKISFSNLSSVLSSQSKQTASSPTSIENLSYKSTNHNEEYLQGYRKIKITSDVNAEDEIIDPPLDDLTYNGPSWYLYVDGDNKYDSVQYWINNVTSIQRLFNHNARLFVNPCDIQAIDRYVVLGLADTWKRETFDVYVESTPVETIIPKSSFSLKQNTVIYARQGTATSPTTRNELEAQTYLGITMLGEVHIPGSCQICLYAKVEKGLKPQNYQKTRGADFIRMYFRIGKKWWNGTGWTSSMATFKVYMNDQNEFMTTRDTQHLYPNAKGYIIPTDTGMTGEMEVGFLNFPSYVTDVGEDYPNQYNIEDFNVRCISYDSDYIRPKNKAEHDFEDVASTAFQNDLSISLDMASGSNTLFGKGQLMNSDSNGNRLTTLSYAGEGSKQPEKHLLDNMTRVFGQVRHRMSIEVAENLNNSDPLTRFLYNSKNYIMQCASHDYVNDKMELTLIEE